MAGNGERKGNERKGKVSLTPEMEAFLGLSQLAAKHAQDWEVFARMIELSPLAARDYLRQVDWQTVEGFWGEQMFYFEGPAVEGNSSSVGNLGVFLAENGARVVLKSGLILDLGFNRGKSFDDVSEEEIGDLITKILSEEKAFLGLDLGATETIVFRKPEEGRNSIGLCIVLESRMISKLGLKVVGQNG